MTNRLVTTYLLCSSPRGRSKIWRGNPGKNSSILNTEDAAILVKQMEILNWIATSSLMTLLAMTVGKGVSTPGLLLRTSYCHPRSPFAILTPPLPSPRRQGPSKKTNRIIKLDCRVVNSLQWREGVAAYLLLIDQGPQDNKWIRLIGPFHKIHILILFRYSIAYNFYQKNVWWFLD